MGFNEAVDILKIEYGNKSIKYGGLVEINFPDSKSRIIIKNNNKTYATCYYNLGGIFVKDPNSPITTIFGRTICDEIKSNIKTPNQGIFTLDELPRYGLNRQDKKQLYQVFNANKKDLVVLYAYNYALAKEMDGYLLDRLKSLLNIKICFN